MIQGEDAGDLGAHDLDGSVPEQLPGHRAVGCLLQRDPSQTAEAVDAKGQAQRSESCASSRGPNA
jgi:hypothetical protein